MGFENHLFTLAILIKINAALDMCSYNLNKMLVSQHGAVSLYEDIDHYISNMKDTERVHVRNKRYTYIEPDRALINKFEKHLTARDGDAEIIKLDEIVSDLVKECDRLSHKALNESIRAYADSHFMVHYNHTEAVYRTYRAKYMDFTESLYHKLIFIMPHFVRKHMRSVFMNVTDDMRRVSYHCVNRFQDLEANVNKHFLSYGELFRSILIDSYYDIEKNFYNMFTDKPQAPLGKQSR